MKIEEKKKSIKLDLIMDDIVYCPITKNFNEIVSNIEKSINESIRMNSYLFKNYPLINEKLDLLNYQKYINIHIKHNNNQNNEINFFIKIKCNKLFLDLYSTNKNTILHDSNFFENIIEKNKMRLIIEFSQISLDYIHNQNIVINLQKINSAFLKDLRISHNSCCLLIDEYSIIDYSIKNKSRDNSTNSLYYLNIEKGKRLPIFNDKNKQLGSIIANIGFVPIIECEKGIIININLLPNDKNNINFGINTNNELIMNDINLKFCKDSLKDILYFTKKLPNDIQTIINLKNLFNENFEKIIIEDDLSINNLKEQLKIEIESVSSIERCSVKDYPNKNNSIYDKLLKSRKENSIESNSDFNLNHIQEKVIQEKSKNKNKRNNYKLVININNINIYLYDGEDFNFQGNHTLVVFYNSPKTENHSTQDNVIKMNERNLNNYILLSIKDFQCKYSQKKNDCDINLLLKSFIIEDNIETSLYKKLLSHYDFQSNENVFFNAKIKIFKQNGIENSGNFCINAVFDITPMAIYLDKNTFDYLFHYFNVVKYLIKNDNEENDEYDINSIETNKKFNNRIIKNNEDIMNISNNEEVKSDSNNEFIDPGISSFNQLKNDGLLKTILNPDKLYIKTLIINNFFIVFTYNCNKVNNSVEDEFETNIKENENNNDNKSYKLKFIECMKGISLNEFMINFKKYDNHEENKLIKIKDIFTELFDFYYNEIIGYKSLNNYLKALPVVSKVCSIFDGFYNIWDKTVNHEKNNNTMKEGFVIGTQELVVNTTCSILSIGDTLSGFFGKLFNKNNMNNRYKKEIIKLMTKQINEHLYEKEEYFYK